MKICVLAGDGVGPEVTKEAIKVLESVGPLFGVDLEFDHQ
ncbi:MAG: 3-isopropylmalate dehydrogenase [Acidobacteria bacterium OLB17]|nr:MAG: 3-isopropylmalate dehydrogenase [Acidobacteria bacterium OLB17]